MNTEYTSFEPPEEETSRTTSENSKLFHWWPPGFLGEDELEPLFSASSSEDAETVEEATPTEEEDLNDALAQRLAHAFRVIDKQFKQINELAEEIDQLETAQRHAQEEVQKVKKRYQMAVQCVLGGLSLAAVLAFHREMSQVGWNAFRWLTASLNIAPESVIGFLTFLAAALLFWQLAKWTYRAAVEEFSGNGGEAHDLGDR